MVKRVVVGAHYGVRDWLIQRVTAFVMALFALLVLGIVLFDRPQHYGAWKGLLSQQWLRLASLLFLLAVFWHAWIGVRDILMDYVKPTGVRLALQVGVVLLLAAYTLWSIEILWSLN
jgi:succinate dehydrogenase / fumarate reductase membrane anchor subunit